MSAVAAFKLILVSLIAIIALELLAKRLRLPPAAALLLGGVALAFAPGLPSVDLDPDLIFIVLLPPLLMDGAYFFVWSDFKRHLNGILLYAIGAVIFTTGLVGVVVHAVAPALPWAACFALGAVVSPPDAVAAKAVLERVALPRRLKVILDGESLLNDASGLVLFRFAVAASLTGTFSAPQAALDFVGLALGGVAVGGVVGYAVVRTLRYLSDDYLAITVSVLAAWFSYVAGDLVDVSPVIATVTCGMVFGWHQHEVFRATVRMRATAFWQVMIFVLEALVFVLIGLSLRGVAHRLGGMDHAIVLLAPVSLVVVAVVVVSRFFWAYGLEAVQVLVARVRGRRSHADWRAATVMGWAGMRGVVTLAVALTLPEQMPGRDLILFSAFLVIFVTVLLQGSTLGVVIRWVNPAYGEGPRYLREPQAWARIEAAELAAVEPLAYGPDGALLHPRLLEQYRYRAELTKRLEGESAYPTEARAAHYDVVLAAIAAGRAELLRLHRSGQIHDDLLHELERDLDLQEIGARHSRG